MPRLARPSASLAARPSAHYGRLAKSFIVWEARSDPEIAAPARPPGRGLVHCNKLSLRKALTGSGCGLVTHSKEDVCEEKAIRQRSSADSWPPTFLLVLDAL